MIDHRRVSLRLTDFGGDLELVDCLPQGIANKNAPYSLGRFRLPRPEELYRHRVLPGRCCRVVSAPVFSANGANAVMPICQAIPWLIVPGTKYKRPDLFGRT